jgi:hypothetical protein
MVDQYGYDDSGVDHAKDVSAVDQASIAPAPISDDHTLELGGLKARILTLETYVERILAHLDPTATSGALHSDDAPVDPDA